MNPQPCKVRLPPPTYEDNRNLVQLLKNPVGESKHEATDLTSKPIFRHPSNLPSQSHGGQQLRTENEPMSIHQQHILLQSEQQLRSKQMEQTRAQMALEEEAKALERKRKEVEETKRREEQELELQEKKWREKKLQFEQEMAEKEKMEQKLLLQRQQVLAAQQMVAQQRSAQRLQRKIIPPPRQALFLSTLLIDNR